MKFQEWCKEILPIIQAGAQGEEIEYTNPTISNNPWLKKEAGGMEGAFIYRIKPRTVNGFEVANAVRYLLEEDQIYFIPSMTSSSWYDSFYWDDDNTNCLNHLDRGIIHLTKEAAVAHAKAMVGIDPNKDSE